MTDSPDYPNAPAEPGEVSDPTLGLSDEEAGFPNHEPPPNDDELGDIEIIEGDGDDIDEED